MSSTPELSGVHLTAIQNRQMGATVDAAPYLLSRTAIGHALRVVRGEATPAAVLTDVRLIRAGYLIACGQSNS